MQVIKSKTVVKLSRQELEDAVRLYIDKHEGVWIDELDIEVDGATLFPKLKMVAQNKHKSETKTETRFWFYVPKDWSNPYCPQEDVNDDSTIEVIYRCGVSATHQSSSLMTSWKQENDPWDVVKYRVIEY